MGELITVDLETGELGLNLQVVSWQEYLKGNDGWKDLLLNTPNCLKTFIGAMLMQVVLEQEIISLNSALMKEIESGSCSTADLEGWVILLEDFSSKQPKKTCVDGSSTFPTTT